MRYRIYRILFKHNLKYAKKIIVQTNVMAEGLEKSYPKLKGRIITVPQPVPNWFNIDLTKTVKKKQTNEKIYLFYPAAGYTHKNHLFLLTLSKAIAGSTNFTSQFEIWLTLTETEFIPYNNIPFVKNLGMLNATQMLKYYQKADALLFLSKLESYGLPLIEALVLGLPIVCINQPYARWICEEKAYYFEDDLIDTLLKALDNLKEDIFAGVLPDYKLTLAKFPTSWHQVVTEFENAFNC